MELKPISTIIVGLDLQKGGKVHKYAIDTARLYMDEFVPYRNGQLRNNARSVDDGVLYPSPYAHYQYIGKLYVDPLYNIGAFHKVVDGVDVFWSRKGVKKYPTDTDLKQNNGGSYWDKRMLSARGDEFFKEIEKYARRHK